MKNVIPTNKVQIAAKRYPLLGAALWISSFQYFAVQFFVSLAWASPYSWSQNTISDLGSTFCGRYADRFVCSPLHLNMNLSLVLLGVTMFTGSALIFHGLYSGSSNNRAPLIGFGCLALAGIGTILVGLFPENSISVLHVLGAGLPFLIGNIGLLILGLVLPLAFGMRVYTLATGTITLVALILLLTQNYLSLGIGGMERLVGYPQTIWFIVFGIYHVMRHVSSD